ncbi:MAG: heparinase II/III family protein [Ktedonobacteraceae bacterium]|nr:heparinase II/III family protein [Ktedonobacteraceae bacterium]
MSVSPARPFNVTEAQLLHACMSTKALFPEIEAVRQQPDVLLQTPQMQLMLAHTQQAMQEIEHIPQTDYTTYRAFQCSGERGHYEAAYFLKRTRLAAAALRLLVGQVDLKAHVENYLWNICEETNWVLPAHENVIIDLFAAETGFVLAETLLLLGTTLESEIRHRVRQEIERRILTPYLRFYASQWWYTTDHNWNGVCNSAVAATFLLIEPEPERTAKALTIALQGLQVFIESAFEADGSSSEGVSYWHYGLMNFVALSEFLYARSAGEINLLASERLQQIAAYPAQVQLYGSQFANFADCDESVGFNPGILTRLAERTHEPSLAKLLASPAQPSSDWRLTMLLRNVLWWDSKQPSASPLADAWLKVGDIARLTTKNIHHDSIVLAVKAGHNGENHNHNDVGSFILNIAGENLLVDPGRGLYSRAYFSDQRYENIFANSYGHSVPIINGKQQGTGHAFTGHIEQVNSEGAYKQVSLEFARAYPVPELLSAKRQLLLGSSGEEAGTIWLRDTFIFNNEASTVEEVFMTWLECTVDGPHALIHGMKYDLRLTIEEPQGVHFMLERLEKESQANEKPGVLKRLSIVLPPARNIHVNVCIQAIPPTLGT